MHWILGTLVVMLCAASAGAQASQPAPPAEDDKAAPAPAAAQEDDADLDVDLAEPDFSLASLPTTLRLPRHKSSFRVTHRFGRPLGRGDFGDLLGDLFGLDNGALIGLEYRFAPFRATQIGIHRTSNKTIEFFAQRQIVEQSETAWLSLDALVTAEGTNNFRDSYSPALGVLLSHKVADRAAFYLEPIWVNNTNTLPEELIDDNSTFMVGLGTRVRIRPNVYLVLEGAPRIGGYGPDEAHVSFGVERRAGGHMFQLNVSNNFGTTLAQVARGGASNDDWYLGFNISRKFFR